MGMDNKNSEVLKIHTKGKIVDVYDNPVPRADVRIALLAPKKEEASKRNKPPKGPNFSVISGSGNKWWAAKTTTNEDGTFSAIIPDGGADKPSHMHVTAYKNGRPSSEKGGDWFACAFVPETEISSEQLIYKMVHERLGTALSGSVMQGEDELDWLQIDLWRSLQKPPQPQYIQAAVRDSPITEEQPHDDLVTDGSFLKAGALTLQLEERFALGYHHPLYRGDPSNTGAESAVKLAWLLDQVSNTPPLPSLLTSNNEGVQPPNPFLMEHTPEPREDQIPDYVKNDEIAKSEWAKNTWEVFSGSMGIYGGTKDTSNTASLGPINSIAMGFDVVSLLISIADEADIIENAPPNEPRVKNTIGNGNRPPPNENRYDMITRSWRDPSFACLNRVPFKYHEGSPITTVGVAGLFQASYYAGGGDDYITLPTDGDPKIYAIDHGITFDSQVKSPLEREEEDGRTGEGAS